MQINISPQNHISPSFRGIHISNAQSCIKDIATTIKLYELSTKSDKNFIKELPKKIKMDNLMPGLSVQEYARWQEMLQYAADNALKQDRKTLLAVTDNKPCGILVFLPGKNRFHLDCICTWPVEYGKKVKLAGSTLFAQLFKKFTSSKAQKLNLEAITNGPYDTVSKYKKLGFIMCGGESNKIFMETNAPQVGNKLKELEEIIHFENINDNTNYKLNEILEI